MDEWPLITVVTPSMNQGPFLEATIRSVLSQGYPNLEYFVVDGGSTDESVDIIRRYADQLAWWVSEKDAGQTDAILKGFSRSRGTVMNWLNSDDQLRPGALFAVARAFSDKHSDLIAGRDRHFKVEPEAPESIFQPAGYAFPGCLRFWDGNFRYHQPSTFFTRSAYERAGGLDRTLHFTMDYDLYCRILSDEGCRVLYLETELSAFRLHDGAKTSNAKAGFIRELRQVSQRYWPSEWRGDMFAEMDAYSAKCSLHQAVEAFRKRQWRLGVQALTLSFRYSPRHAVFYPLSRLFA